MKRFNFFLLTVIVAIQVRSAQCAQRFVDDVIPPSQALKSDSVLTRIISGGDTLTVYLAHTPEFKDGQEAYAKLLAQNIRYPADAQRAGRTGRVQVGFWIDERGKISGLKSLRRLGSGLDEEAIRCVGLTNRKWAPVLYRGKAVKAYHIIMVSFDL